MSSRDGFAPPSDISFPEMVFSMPPQLVARARRTSRVASTRRNPRKSKSNKARIAVLVVDDVHDVTEMIEWFLKHAGYEVITADSASRALDLADKTPFDLVISDIGMPAMNGYELAEALRNLPKYQAVPLIAVTGYTEFDDRGRSLRAGFNAHLTKPIDPSQLLSIINELLS